MYFPEDLVDGLLRDDVPWGDLTTSSLGIGNQIGTMQFRSRFAGTLVVRFKYSITNHVSSRSNFFHRNGTGDSLISAIPLSIRSFNSSLDVTRM